MITMGVLVAAVWRNAVSALGRVVVHTAPPVSSASGSRRRAAEQRRQEPDQRAGDHAGEGDASADDQQTQGG